MTETILQYYKKVNEVRNEILRLSIKEFADKSMMDGKGARIMTATGGNLVLIKNTDNEKTGTYGVISELKSESTAIVKTKKGLIRRAISQFVPLAPASVTNLLDCQIRRNFWRS